MEWINYHHLYYFYIIATEQGVTKASQKLKVAQSTLSAQLGMFEGNLGFRLFERHGKRLVLTETGKRVFDYADEIFRLGNELKDMLRDRGVNNKVKIQIGLEDSIPRHFAQVLVAKALSGGSSTVTVKVGPLNSLMEELQTHRLDLLVSTTQVPSEGGFRAFHHLFEEFPVFFFAAPIYHEHVLGFPHSMEKAPLLLSSQGSALRREVDQYFALNHLYLEPLVESNDFDFLKLLTVEGQGVCPLPKVMVEEELKQGKLIKLSNTPVYHERIWIVTAHRRIDNPVARLILSEV